jgi:hypothetical protein
MFFPLSIAPAPGDASLRLELPVLARLRALSADDGSLLWTKKKVANNPNAVYVDCKGLLGVGPGGSHVMIDPSSREDGKVRAFDADSGQVSIAPALADALFDALDLPRIAERLDGPDSPNYRLEDRHVCTDIVPSISSTVEIRRGSETQCVSGDA